MNTKNILIALAVIVVLGVLAIIGFGGSTDQTQDTSDQKLSVVASFYPIYFLTSEIGGNRAEVINLMPDGAGPHDYEPTAQDIVRIHSSRLFILSGGVEEWGDDIKNGLNPKNTVVVSASDGLRTQTFTEDGVAAEDPHVWLSPLLAKKMTDNILEGYKTADPKNTEYYQANADSLKTRLEELDTEFKQGLAMCAKRDVIGSHGAFGYLGTAYNLNPISIAGLSPEAEPSLQKLTEIADFAKKNDVRVIFFESVVSPKLSQTIATEVGAKTMVLDTLERITKEDAESGEDYMTIMRQNLANLKIALICTP